MPIKSKFHRLQRRGEQPRAVERSNRLRGTKKEEPEQPLSPAVSSDSQPGAFPVQGNRRPSTSSSHASDDEDVEVVTAELVDTSVELERDDLRRRLEEMEKSTVVGQVSTKNNQQQWTKMKILAAVLIVTASIVTAVLLLLPRENVSGNLPPPKLRWDNSLVWTRPKTVEEKLEMETMEQSAYCYEKWCNATKEGENVTDFLEWNDDALFRRGLSGLRIGDHCEILYSVTRDCPYYVVGRPSERNPSYFGIPLNVDGLGTGCVSSGPDCWFRKGGYELTSEEIESFCSDSLESNAVAQLRYGIRNGRCTGETDHFRNYFPTCANAFQDDTPDIYCNETYPFCVTRGNTEPPFRARGSFCTDCPVGNLCSLRLLELPDEELVQLASSGQTIGDYCRVMESSDCENGLAVVGREDDYAGIPRNNEEGSGCVFLGDLFECPHRKPTLYVPNDEASEMCAGRDLAANAAGQLRYALRRGLCNDPCSTMLCDL